MENLKINGSELLLRIKDLGLSESDWNLYCKIKEIIHTIQEDTAEEHYRRGYRQGFDASRKNPDISSSKVQMWGHDLDDRSPAPGSYFDKLGHKTYPPEKE